MGKDLKFQGIIQLHAFRHQIQTHIILFSASLVTCEAKVEENLIIPDNFRTVHGEPFLYPLFTVVVLMPQVTLLDLVGLMLFIPIHIAVGHIPHIVIPCEVSDIRERVYLRHEIIAFWVQIVP